MSAESLDTVDSQKFFAKMVVNGHDIQFQLDSGATVNVLPAREYKKVCDDPGLKELEASEAQYVGGIADISSTPGIRS